MYTQTSGHVGEYYGPNSSCTESTSYPEKKVKARIRLMNFSQKYMSSVFLGHPVYKEVIQNASSWLLFAQSADAAEYTDCFSAGG